MSLFTYELAARPPQPFDGHKDYNFNDMWFYNAERRVFATLVESNDPDNEPDNDPMVWEIAVNGGDTEMLEAIFRFSQSGWSTSERLHAFIEALQAFREWDKEMEAVAEWRSGLTPASPEGK